MSLPLPAYAIKLDLLFDGRLTAVIVVKANGSPATNRHIIEWGKLTEKEQADLTRIADLYGGAFPLSAPVAGYQVISLNSTEATGYSLDGLRQFYLVIRVDGTLHRLTFNERAVTTRTSIINLLNAKLSGSATATLVGNNIVVTSDTVGNGSTISISQEGDRNLFSGMDQFVKWNDPVPGANNGIQALRQNHVYLDTKVWRIKERIFSDNRRDLTKIATSDLPFLRFLDTVGDGSGTKIMNNNYGGGSPAGVPTTFRFTPPPGTVAIVNALNVHYSDTGSFTFDGFGANASPLTNGVAVKATIDGITYDFTDGVPIRKNADWQHIASGTLLNVWANPGDTLLAQLNISSFGRPIILIAARGDELFVELSDDFSFLDDFHVVAHGFL